MIPLFDKKIMKEEMNIYRKLKKYPNDKKLKKELKAIKEKNALKAKEVKEFNEKRKDLTAEHKKDKRWK